MAFCSFDKELAAVSTTNIENVFINSYLPESDGNAVKVYLYGLYLCENSSDDISSAEFSKNICLDESVVKDCFKYWEEFGAVNILSDEPFIVKYLPLTSFNKPKKIRVEKYNEFNKSLQVLITGRMITTNEYSEYMALMEDFSIKPEAMLMIVNYCVELKGPDIGFRYIIKVARDFAERGITTVEAVEKELSDYTVRSSDICRVLSALGLKRKPEIEDLNLYKKWIKDLGFSEDAVLYSAKESKAKSVKKLDEVMNELYGSKKFSEKEICDYLKNKQNIKELAYKISRALSVYCEVIDPVLDNYVIPWLNKGYDEETLLFIANFCFRKNRRTFEDMNKKMDSFYSSGLITLVSIADYIKRNAEDDKFINQILNITGIIRKPTEWDRNNIRTWRVWNFSDEMILEAAKISSGKNSPLTYINAVLSDWKTNNIYTPDKIVRSVAENKVKNNTSVQRKFSTEELNKLIDGIDDINF